MNSKRCASTPVSTTSFVGFDFFYFAVVAEIFEMSKMKLLSTFQLATQTLTNILASTAEFQEQNSFNFV